MTRIKKRRTGKKRTTDRKKASAGRRGARAAKKETILPVKKAAGGPAKEAVQGKSPASPVKQTGSPVKQTGKTRSAGARRVAVSRSVANTISNKKAGPKPPPAAKKTGTKKPGKGFAPWNKNKFNSKRKEE